MARQRQIYIEPNRYRFRQPDKEISRDPGKDRFKNTETQKQADIQPARERHVVILQPIDYNVLAACRRATW